MKPRWSDVQNARNLLQQHFSATPLSIASSLSKGPRAGVYLKLESEMPTGSFKR